MGGSSDDPLGTITIDLGNIDVSGSTYISGGTGIDTITIDPSWPSGSITSASSVTWSQDYTTSWSNSYNDASVNIDTNGISVKEGGDIKIGGKSLSQAIEKIEERLGILHPNPELENRWEQLKALRQQYMELEKDILEKEKIMDILKKE
jgi:hypothetical protein